MKTNNPFLVLLFKKLALVLVLYQISRILFYIFNNNHFSKVNYLDFLYGSRFDLSAILYSNFLIIIALSIPGTFKYNSLYLKTIKILFFIINAIFLSTNFIDIEYFKFTGRRSSFSMITAKGMEQEIPALLYSFILEFWHIPLLLTLLLILFWKSIPKIKGTVKPNQQTKKDYIIQTGMLLFILGLSFLGARGGIQEKPLRRIHAINHVGIHNVSLVLNTPFCILKTLVKKGDLTNLTYYKEKDLPLFFNPIKTFNPDTTSIKKNVIILILESFGDENIGFDNNGLGYTPFLDSLITQSLYFKNAFANGRLSIDAVPSILSSIPSLMEGNFIHSTYAFNKTNSLPALLKKEGYYTSFFHGAFNGSQNFDQYAKIAGFEDYFGKNEYPYPGGEDGRWGIFDEEFLQFFGEKLNTFKEPFFSTLFTISSHNPYIIPEKHREKFPKGTEKIHESIGYTDYSLKKFFEYAKKQKWYNNTLFVLSADHCSSAGTGFYKTKLGKFSIPILFFDPSNPNLKGVNYKNFQQIDILPSILEYLNYKGTILTFGNELSKNDRIIAFYQSGVYHFVKNEYYLIFDGTKTIGFYNWVQDRMQIKNLTHNNNNSKELQNIEKEAKAYIQTFNTRVINNKLTPE